ncbi:MAG: hypothetical protein L0H64_03225, partial [Pseudonocardia sp.]|nr:hypothetical protein [Pseudonocardia sp.]
MELFRTALEEPDPPFAVLYVHGPTGIGKTGVLDAFEALAAETGDVVIRVDGHDVAPESDAVLAALRAGLDVPDGGGGIRGAGRPVLLVDTYELLAPLDEWFRARLLPRLPGGAVTVLAGRHPPAPAGRANPGWRDLMRVVALRNL